MFVFLASCTVSVACGPVASHGVAALPSTAATGSSPGTNELAVTCCQRARSLVGWRSGRRVAIVTLCPGATVTSPAGVWTGSAEPEVSCTWVDRGPIVTVNTRPCHWRLWSVIPCSCGDRLGSSLIAFGVNRSPEYPYSKTCKNPPTPVRKLKAVLGPLRVSANWSYGARRNGSLLRSI